MRRLIGRSGKRLRLRRRGTALVEFAVVLPLLLMILMGIIEFGWIFMVRQTLTNAAREGCRVAVLKAATADDVALRVREVMTPLGYAEGTVWTFTATPIGDEVQTIQVSVPISEISLTGGYVLQGGSYMLTGEASMRKEGVLGG
jgi:TadE-like protein